MNKNTECSECFFFSNKGLDNGDIEEDLGNCRRFPPIVISKLVDTKFKLGSGMAVWSATYFPVVEQSERICGEFKAKETKNA